MIYNLESLRNAYIAGKTFKYLFFWRPTLPPDGTVNQSCFSQWWICDFTVDTVRYNCTEQFMMAEKARLFGDNDMLEKILASKHPKEMKAFGRMVSNFQKDIWDSKCYEIVKKGNIAKFSQNELLGHYLGESKNRILVEASPRDRIWGIGMGKTNPDAENPMKWRGENLLGFALTEVRDILFQNK